MEIKRTHPLIITAAVAIILAAGIAIASMTGLLPSSNANMSDQEIAQMEEKARLEEEAKAKQEAAAKKAASKPAPTKAAATCNTCGRVVEIRQRTVQGEGSGIGAVAGGVVGGLLGNQIGGGQGYGVHSQRFLRDHRDQPLGVPFHFVQPVHGGNLPCVRHPTEALAE